MTLLTVHRGGAETLTLLQHNKAPQLLNTEGNFDHTTKDISEAQRIRCPSVQCESRNTLTLRLSNHPRCSHIVATPSPGQVIHSVTFSMAAILCMCVCVRVCVCVCGR